jgi:hypothetical protein
MFCWSMTIITLFFKLPSRSQATTIEKDRNGIARFPVWKLQRRHIWSHESWQASKLPVYACFETFHFSKVFGCNSLFFIILVSLDLWFKIWSSRNEDSLLYPMTRTFFPCRFILCRWPSYWLYFFQLCTCSQVNDVG